MNKKLKNTSLIIIICSLFFVAGCSEKEQAATETERLSSAKTYLAEDGIRAAIIELKNILQQNPSNTEARYLLGKIYVSLGNGNAAIKELEKAQGLGARSDELYYLLAKSYEGSREFQQLIDKKFLSLISTEDYKRNIEGLEAKAYVMVGETKKAFDVISGFDAAEGLTFEQLDAKYQYETRRGKFSEAMALLVQNENRFSDSSEFYLAKASGYYSTGEYGAANESYLKAKSLAPQNINSRQKFLSEVGSVRSLVALDKYAEAKQSNDILLKSVSQHPAPNFLAGMIEFRLGNHIAANEFFVKVQKMAPSHKLNQLMLGASSFAIGSFEQADVYLTSFLNSEPTHIQARRLLISTRAALNKPEEVSELAKPLLARDSSDKQLLMLVGNSILQSGNVEDGLDFIKRAAKGAKNLNIRRALAEAFIRTNHGGEALKELDALILSSPDDIRIHQLMTLAHVRESDLVSAEIAIDKALALNEKDPVSLVLKANINLLKNEVNAAKEGFDTALQQQPGFSPALSGLALLASNRGDLESAEQLYGSIISQNRSDERANIGLASVQVRNGDLQSAIETLSTAVGSSIVVKLTLANYYFYNGEWKKSEKLLFEIVKEHEKEAAGWLLLGRVHMALNKPERALKSFINTAKLLPNVAGPQFEIARAHAGLEDIDSAITALEKALKAQQNYTEAAFALGRLYVRNKSFKSAKRLADKLLKDNPAGLPGYALLAEYHVATNSKDKAYSVLKKAHKKIGSSASLNYLALFEGERGNKEQEISLLRDWVEKNKDDLKMRSLLASKLLMYGDTKAARPVLENLYSLLNRNVVVVNNLAQLELIEGNDKKALKYARVAFELAPGDAIVRDTYAWASLKTNTSVDQAAEIIRELYEMNRNSPEITYHYSVVLSREGKKAEAKMLLKKLLSTNESFLERSEAEAFLNSISN